MRGLGRLRRNAMTRLRERLRRAVNNQVTTSRYVYTRITADIVTNLIEMPFQFVDVV